jgi:ribosomal protein S19E (S16A)
VGKSLMADGWKPHGNISKSGSQIEVPITQFLKTGKIEFQKGILTEKGQQLIDYLTELTKLDTKILKGGSASRMAEKNISKYITKVIEMLNWFTSVDVRPNYLLFTHDLEDIVKYDLEQLNKMNNSWSDFEKASKMIFSFHGFKNRIHEIIKETIKNDGGINHYIKSFFGDIDIALGIFNKMDSMNESWHGTMKSLYDYNDIFLNPTKKEMKKDLDGLMRGVILPNGDLYVARAVGTIHRTIIKYLIEKGIIEKQYDLINISRWISPNTDLLFVQNREDDINTFYLAESYSSFWDNDLDDGRLNYLKEIAKKCEAKNNIKIVFKRIWDR